MPTRRLEPHSPNFAYNEEVWQMPERERESEREREREREKP